MSLFKRTRKHQLEVAAQGKVSGMAVLLNVLTDATSGLDAPIVHLAAGDLVSLSERREFEAPFNVFGRIGLAEMVASRSGRDGTVREITEKIARMIGELAATWTNISKTTTLDATTALTKISTFILNHPPTIPQVSRYALGSIKIIRARANGIMIPGEDVTETLGFLNPMYTEYTDQWVEFHRLRLQWFDWTLITNLPIGVKAAFESLIPESAGNEEVVVEPTDNVSFDSERFVVWWKNIDDDSRFAMVEGIYYHQCAISRRNAVGSVFASLVSFVKDINITSDWLTRRREVLARETGIAGLEDVVTQDVLTTFGRLYPKTKLNADNIFDYVTSLYATLSSIECQSMRWILEQAACSNITVAVDFARCVSKNAFICLQYLILKVPASQLTKFAQLCITMARDRFCSLKEPPVTMREIADLAYLGSHMITRQEKRKNFGSLNQLSSKCTLTRTELDAIIDESVRMYDESLAQQNSIVHMFRKDPTSFGYEPGTMIMQQGDEQYAFIVPASSTTQPGNMDRESLDLQREIRQSERADWPRGMKAAAPGTVRATLVELGERLSAKRTPKEEALILLSSLLVSTAEQIRLSDITPENLNVLLRYPAIPKAALDAATLFGFTAPAGWDTDGMRARVAYVDDIPMSSFEKSYREPTIIPQVDRAGPYTSSPRSPAPTQGVSHGATPKQRLYTTNFRFSTQEAKNKVGNKLKKNHPGINEDDLVTIVNTMQGFERDGKWLPLSSCYNDHGFTKWVYEETTHKDVIPRYERSSFNNYVVCRLLLNDPTTVTLILLLSEDIGYSNTVQLYETYSRDVLNQTINLSAQSS